MGSHLCYSLGRLPFGWATVANVYMAVSRAWVLWTSVNEELSGVPSSHMPTKTKSSLATLTHTP